LCNNPEVNGRIILSWIMDWIDVAQDRDMWQALVNMVMSLWVP
jgi:hypothetical protein